MIARSVPERMKIGHRRPTKVISRHVGHEMTRATRRRVSPDLNHSHRNRRGKKFQFLVGIPLVSSRMIRRLALATRYLRPSTIP